MAHVVAMPKLGFDMAEGRLIRWLKAEGERVQKGDVLAEIETDKATVEVEAPAAGLVRRQLVSEGTAVPVGTPIAILAEADEPIADLAAGAPAPAAVSRAEAGEPSAAPPSTAAPAESGRLPGGVRASPLARRVARQAGVDLAAVTGSGPQGRVLRRDVEAAAARGAAAPAVPRAAERVVPSRLRAAIGRRMTQAKQQAPHFYVTTEIDAGPMMALREELNALLPESEKISVNDFIVKAAALTLRQFPNLNASLDGDAVLRHAQVNVGVAVALEDGLITVVTRDTDRKPIRELSEETRQMVARARQGKVRPEDIEGSTFSVSNLGMFDVDHFIAIINPPEAAILAVGSVRQIPVVHEGQVRIGQRLKVTLSADHRLTDGAEAARWLQAFKRLLEHPLRLVL